MSLLRNKWLWLSALGVVLSVGVLAVLMGYLALVVYRDLYHHQPTSVNCSSGYS